MGEFSLGEFLLVALVLIFVMGGYWVFILMPRQRDFRKRQQMARSLAAGDEVITGGGLVGKIQRIDADMGVAYVELAEGVEVRIVLAALIDRYDPQHIAEQARMGGDVE